MFRSAILRSSASAVRAAVRPATSNVVRRTTLLAAPRVAVPRVQSLVAVRMYSAGAGLKKEEVEGRIMSLLQGFDKVGGLFFSICHTLATQRCIYCWNRYMQGMQHQLHLNALAAERGVEGREEC